LASDNSEFDSKAKLEETSNVIESLLNLLSQMFTLACRNSLKSEHASKPSYNSVDFSNHESSINREVMPGHKMDSAIQLSSY